MYEARQDRFIVEGHWRIAASLGTIAEFNYNHCAFYCLVRQIFVIMVVGMPLARTVKNMTLFGGHFE